MNSLRNVFSRTQQTPEDNARIHMNVQESFYIILKLTAEDALEYNTNVRINREFIECLFEKKFMLTRSKRRHNCDIPNFKDYDTLVEHLFYLQDIIGKKVLIWLVLDLSDRLKTLLIHMKYGMIQSFLSFTHGKITDTREKIFELNRNIMEHNGKIPKQLKEHLIDLEFGLDLLFALERMALVLIEYNKERKMLTLYRMSKSGVYPDLLDMTLKFMQ